MLDSKTILIVDGSAYGGLDLASAIEELDGRVAGPVSTASDALAILDSQSVAAAVVDCELGDALAIVMRLADHDVPLIVHASSPLPQSIAFLDGQVSVLLKPVDVRTVIDTLLVKIGSEARPPLDNRLAIQPKQV